jgi:hypothetical protein
MKYENLYATVGLQPALPRFSNGATATALTLSVDVKCAEFREIGHEFVTDEVSN